MLGEFEYLVLAIAHGLGDEAYGASIRSELDKVVGRACSIGAVYTTLDRLEHKGFITTTMGEPTAARGGRAKRLIRLTRSGVAEAKSFYNSVLAASQGTAWANSTRNTR